MDRKSRAIYARRRWRILDKKEDTEISPSVSNDLLDEERADKNENNQLFEVE